MFIQLLPLYNIIDSCVTAVLKIYPNPISSGTVNIENAASGVVSIYNTIGQKMLTQNMDASNTTINISVLQKGIYLIILQSNGAKQTTKLYIE